MRFIVYGAGAVGGLAGGLMADKGEDVVLIARGAHGDAIRAGGLTIESAEGSRTVSVPVAADPEEARVGEGDVVILGMKSQDTPAALEALRRVAPPSVPVVCLQNGVDNERSSLRLFSHVYGVCVMCPAGHLEPGVVEQHSVPVPGMLDLGRYPDGVDDTAAAVAAAFRSGGFESIVRPDIMRWKFRKLLLNLGNAVDALCRPPDRGQLTRRARAEAEACFRAAGVTWVSAEEDAERRGGILQVKDIEGRPRGGGSSWQSLRRRRGSIESDYLNGEITLLGRLHGVPTPVNDVLQQLAVEAARRGDPPGSLSVDQIRAFLGA